MEQRSQHLPVVGKTASGDSVTMGEVPLLLKEADADDCQLRVWTAFLGENMVVHKN
jgi:hypothetical protein